ncbi:hypothetical protein CY35_11G073800 [Sphagnum magellanicum]|nr:hypothetical protein CY35_11G073800 [Sphagnum magellanicum]
MADQDRTRMSAGSAPEAPQGSGEDTGVRHADKRLGESTPHAETASRSSGAGVGSFTAASRCNGRNVQQDRAGNDGRHFIAQDVQRDARLGEDSEQGATGGFRRLLSSRDAAGRSQRLSEAQVHRRCEMLGRGGEASGAGCKLQHRLSPLAPSPTISCQLAGGTTCSELDGGLLDMALRQLEGEFKRLVGEHGVVMWLPAIMPSEETTTTTDDSSSTTTNDKDLQPSFAPDVMQKLHAILERVAADSNNHRHRACLQMYQETRSSLIRLSLQALQVQYLKNSTPELVDRVESEELQNMIGFWMQHLEVAVKVLYAGERRLACQVFKDLGQPVWAECVGKVAHAGMIAFLQFGEAVACSERAPEKLCGLLDMFDAMEKCAKSILRVFDGEMNGIRSRYRELQKQVVYGASKTFQEIARWIEVQNYPLAFDGGVTQLSSYVVNYLKYLVQEYSSAINKVLRIEHSWRSEDQLQEMDLSMWILQFMQALEQQVESRSKEHSNTALRHIFMMNNLYYICNRAKMSELGPLLGESWLSNLSQKVEKHALRFQKEAWKPVLVHLGRDRLSLSSGGRSAARELVRQRLRSFAASFEEACLTQSKWIIAEEDLRVGVQVSVVQAVVPAYRTYLQNFGSFLDSQSSFPNKYVKYSPEMVEKMLGELFMAGRSNNGSNRHTPIEDHQV